MSMCNNCHKDPVDILRSDIIIGAPECPRCEEQCPEEDCDCPSGHMQDTCIHYSGCAKFIMGINKGMTYDQIVDKIERVFCVIDKKMEDFENRINSLERDRE